MGDFSWENGGTLPQNSYNPYSQDLREVKTVNENHIGLLVSRYYGTDKHPVILSLGLVGFSYFAWMYLAKCIFQLNT